MIKAVRFWLDKGGDGMRLVTFASMTKDLGLPSNIARRWSSKGSRSGHDGCAQRTTRTI